MYINKIVTYMGVVYMYIQKQWIYLISENKCKMYFNLLSNNILFLLELSCNFLR